MNNIQQTIQYLTDSFENSAYLMDKPKDKQYRLEHSFRVARIGKIIAQKENLDVEATIIGSLLHDISYIYEMKTNEERRDHGRESAKIAKQFVMGLNMEEYLKHELLYGIAMHVDDEAGFEGERTLLAETIGEADNIDRFDRYRLYETLYYSKLNEMSLDEKKEEVSKQIQQLKKRKSYTFKSTTSNAMWQEKLDMQIEFYQGLAEQFKKSKPVGLSDF